MTNAHAYAAKCLGWWCTLPESDKAAWASAAGSFFAALIALMIALTGWRVRAWQRRKDGRALAAYLASDVFDVYTTLQKAIDYIEDFLQTGNGLLSNELFAFAAGIEIGLQAPLLRSTVDRFGLLPGNAGESLAGAVGSLGGCQTAISALAANLRQIEPGEWPEYCGRVLRTLRTTKDALQESLIYCQEVTGRTA